MNEREIKEFEKLELQYVKNVVKNPESLKESSSMNGGIWFITTGVKQKERARHSAEVGDHLAVILSQHIDPPS